jgi:DNA repair exonuclease SbcCD ATPase subunit
MINWQGEIDSLGA